MAWWQNTDFVGDLNEVLSHVNEATDASLSATATRTCELYFHALNKLWNAFARHEGNPGRADTPSFISLLRCISEDSQLILLRSKALKELIDLTPEVLDHHVLKTRGHRPGQEITPPLRHDADEKHRKLRSAHCSFLEENPDATGAAVLKKLAEFLFVVRSNIAHGEKSPYGRDKEKARRDEKVSRLVIPVQKVIIDLIFDRPSQNLVAYGTLRPGGANEEVLKGFGGDWQECSVRGTIREQGSLRFFRWNPRAEPIEAMLFRAPDLINNWAVLDSFEGHCYRRHLVPVEANGIWYVANAFEDVRGSDAG